MFRADFERRLARLYKCLTYYYESGLEGSLIASLFSCFSYLWCNSNFRLKVKKN